MINKVLCLLLVCVCVSFTATKRKQFIPPGTIQITETFFADEVEITNLAWTEYESWTSDKYGYLSKEHLGTLPDTSVWLDKTAYNEPYAKYYYRHSAYKNFPVVGISFEQAVAFCKWRTERVKDYYAIRYKKELVIEYRLPTKEEWERISNNGWAIFTNAGKNNKGQMVFNHIHERDTTERTGCVSNEADVIAPAYSYWKNSFGLFNTFGNVCEMVSEKGTCKGGSWRHKLEECRPGKNIPYSKPEAWLGFRCVCTMAPKTQ
jgi:formylglycine-generating enzyme required for sulfatase activity